MILSVAHSSLQSVTLKILYAHDVILTCECLLALKRLRSHDINHCNQSHQPLPLSTSILHTHKVSNKIITCLFQSNSHTTFLLTRFLSSWFLFPSKSYGSVLSGSVPVLIMCQCPPKGNSQHCKEYHSQQHWWTMRIIRAIHLALKRSNPSEEVNCCVCCQYNRQQ